MKQEGPVIEGREVVDMRLLALLRELARDHGRKKAAAMLAVDRGTLDAGLDEGVLSRRMRRALDRALQSGLGSAAEEQRDRNDRLEERLTDMEGAVNGLAREVRRRLAGIEGVVEALRRDDAMGTRAGHAGAGPSRADSDEPGEPAQGEKPPSKPRVRRDYPELVTREPAEDDEAVFSDAWPLVVERRELKDSHSNEGKGFKWLSGRKRLLEMELALLEEHGMTLPPERQPLHGLDRSGQTSWRWTAFYNTRRAWFWRWRVRQVLRFVTFGRLWQDLASDAGSIPRRNQRRSS